MYIEQAYKGKPELWKYLIIPGLFLGYMALNFVVMAFLPQGDIEELMAQMIAEMGEINFLIQMLLPFAVALGLLFLWVKYIHKQSITSLTTSRDRIDWGRIFFAFFLWGILTTIFVFVDYKLEPENYEWNFDMSLFLQLAAVAILLIPLQTSFEEYFFRGYLIQGLGIYAGNRWIPLVITSLFFGLLHLGNPEVGKLGYGIMIYYIGTGFFLGVITLMDEGLELALGFHAANNLFTALLVTANWTAFQTPSVLREVSQPSLGYDVLVPVFVVFPLLILIFSKRYRWTNWKERLAGKVAGNEVAGAVSS
ncbi:CPBP family intramembrane metalloprotease [Robertkochia marina]|uniref:CPBP family intramembrane metalloprotease n=1 Tax=Robertkochia marina TaxID=1227945 RepID=A0A4V3UY53_9FLAO|nr:CPBP family intramembrane glutamic endopeptidase [Robertkochia marina]THD67776.1 CPBP family intramembrane metalloprotease [Robertkochia marina]TRZ41748.1 CPBP family intramembrane metalloprotease [Robertkochia marina]